MSEIVNMNSDTMQVVANTLGNLHRGVYVMTFGCQQNEADSEKLLGMACEMGYEQVSSPEEADLILINTCAIREHAEQKVFSYLGNLKLLKNTNSDLIIGVCGCMTAQEHRVNYLKESFPYVSFTLDPASISSFPEVLLHALGHKKRKFIMGNEKPDVIEGIPTYRTNKIKAWVSIMYGCNNFCTYCIVPYVRGRERSRMSSDIVEEVKSLVDAGCKEVTLLGQNVNSYAGDCNFAELVEKIAKLDGDFVIRFMTSHPKDVSDELIDVMAKYTGRVAPHFHLPLQSGSDAILKRMNRHYNLERYLSVAKKLKEKIPGIAITTDIIVGFPGETDEDFDMTMKVIEEVRYDSIYAFLYSKRKGTPAESMPDQVSNIKRKERMARLIALQEKISSEVAKPYEGKMVRVLVDAIDEKGVLSGRTGSFRLVKFEGPKELIGSFVTVQVEKANAATLLGKRIEI